MNLSEYLEKNNISVTKFAEIVGVDRQNVYKWIKGTIPRKHIIDKIITTTNGDVAAEDFYNTPKADNSIQVAQIEPETINI